MSLAAKLAGLVIFISQPGWAATLDLPATLTYAMQHSPKIAKAKSLSTVATLQSEQAAAKQFPSLDLTTNQGLRKTLPTPQPEPRGPQFATLGLGLTETIYDNGDTAAQKAIALLNKDSAVVAVDKARNDIALDVARSYYRLTQMQLILETKKQQKELLAKQFRQFGNLYRQGLKTKKDFQRFQSQVQRANLDVIAAEADRKNADIDLRRIIGAPLDPAATSPDLQFTTIEPDTIAGSAAQLLRHPPKEFPSVDSQPALRIAKLNAAASEESLELARHKHLYPEITVTTGANFTNNDELGLEGQPWATNNLTWHLTLGISYNFFDYGTRRRNVALAVEQQQSLAEEAREQTLQISAELHQLQAALKTLSATFELNRQLMVLDAENFANLEADYREGRVAYLDLVTGLNDLLQAKVAYYSAAIAVMTNFAQLYYYQGRIYEVLASH